MTDYDVIVVGGGPPGEHCAGAIQPFPTLSEIYAAALSTRRASIRQPVGAVPG